MRTEPFPTWPVWGQSDEDALLEVLRSGQWGRIGGKKNEELEERFARYHNAAYGVTCVNGTAALEIAFRALGIDEGDEVISPAYTFIATASAAVLAGATPRFADIDPGTYNLDPAKVEEAITPRTKAIVAVHIAGCPAGLDALSHLAQKHGLALLEDAAQAIGAEWRHRKVGSIGAMGTFSFQSSKNLNSGEGGIITTNDRALADTAWSLMNVGRTKGGAWYDHPVLGWNYRMTEFQAALVLSQMDRLEEQMRTREEHAAYLSARLRDAGGLRPLATGEGVTRHAHHIFIVRYQSEEFGGLPRDRFLRAMSAEGIPMSAGYVPLHKFQALQNSRPEAHYDRVHLPVTERACYEEACWLTQNVLLGSKKDLDDVVEAVLKVKSNAAELMAQTG